MAGWAFSALLGNHAFVVSMKEAMVFMLFFLFFSTSINFQENSREVYRSASAVTSWLKPTNNLGARIRTSNDKTFSVPDAQLFSDEAAVERWLGTVVRHSSTDQGECRMLCSYMCISPVIPLLWWA